MITDICLCLAILVSYVLVTIINIRFKEKKTAKIISLLFVELIIWTAGVLFQRLLGIRFNINLIYFDYITYIGICTLFPTLMYLCYAYKNENKKIPKTFSLFYIIPIICLIILWTNEYHNMFYKEYSVNFAETEYGIMFYINTIYSYSLAAVFIWQMMKTSIQKSGFLSKQTGFMIIGSLIPLVINVLGTTKVLNISIYVTPIMFTVTLICYAIAIFKYKALNITPIALKTIVNTMNDAFVVISNDGTIVNSNKEFNEKFSLHIEKDINENNIFKTLTRLQNEDLINFYNKILRCIEKDEIIDTELHISSNLDGTKNIEQSELEHFFFEVNITPIKNTDRYNKSVGVLILIKDITQHKKDLKALEEKQEIIVKQAQLVSIGELAGGVAHDINTPISAIKTGITMLKVTNDSRTDDEKQIIDTMENCSDKIINIVNSMRNQIRNLGGNTDTIFKISNVINDIKCITYHEVKKYKADVEVEIEDDLSIKGDPAKFGQVMTNLVVNAAQAYKNTNGGKIKVVVMKGPESMAIVKVIDFAGGISEEIASNIFKTILTTKGIEGTGLGLYLAYSVIKGNFNGEINFDTEKGVGTTFYIKIPIATEEK